MRPFAFLLVLLVATACLAEDRRTDQTKLRVMHLNAEFMWDGLEPEEGNADFEWKGDEDAAKEHMKDVAEIIKNGNPDILNLCEVENIEALEMLNIEFLEGLGYKAFLVDGTDTATGQDVGILSRVDPLFIERDDRKGRSGSTKKSVSKNYVAEFEINGTKIALIGTHLLAFPTREDRKPSRQAQAAAISGMAVDERDNGFLPIVLGDFNDFDGEDLDHVDNTPITNVLKRIRRMEAGNPDDDLINVARLVPKADRFTAWHDANHNGQNDGGNELSSIDHVCVAPELAARIGTVQFLHDHDPLGHPDHYGIVVEFNMTGTPRFAPEAAPELAAVRAASVLEAPQPANRYQIVPGQGNTKYVVLDAVTGRVWERVTVDGKDEWKAVESPPSN